MQSVCCSSLYCSYALKKRSKGMKFSPKVYSQAAIVVNAINQKVDSVSMVSIGVFSKLERVVITETLQSKVF
jgi:hypothetical protein